jgi:hypothetical protein
MSSCNITLVSHGVVPDGLLQGGVTEGAISITGPFDKIQRVDGACVLPAFDAREAK